MTASRVRHYTAFGLVIASEIGLDPFLPPCDGAVSPDVRVRVGIPMAAREDTDLELEWPATARLLLRGSGAVFVDPAVTATSEMLAEQLASTLLAIVLERSGTFVLHASAVEIGGTAVVFMGRSGSGKSSAAALMAAHGCALLADDYVPIRPAGSRAVCLAGPRVLKLTPQAREALASLSGIGTGALSGKQLVAGPVSSGDPAVTPVTTVYALDDGNEVAASDLTGQSALAALLRNAFCLPVVAPSARTAHLIRCAEVAQRVRIRRLSRPRDWSRAGELVEWLTREHARS